MDFGQEVPLGDAHMIVDQEVHATNLGDTMVVDQEVHVETIKGSDILSIHKTREDLHASSKHANGSINIPETDNDNIQETNNIKDLPIDTKKDLQKGEVEYCYKNPATRRYGSSI